MIAFPPPAQALTMNQRLHWAQRSKISRAWRDAAGQAAMRWVRTEGVTFPGPSIVTVALPVVGNRRRDPHNWFPTVKPIIDGLVDAGVWPDDTPAWVRCLEPDLVVGGELVTVTCTPMNGAA